MVRRSDDLRSTSILVITGQDNEVARTTLDYGTDAYLTKPIEFDDLINTIVELNSRPVASRS